MARFIRLTEMPNGKDLMLNIEFIVYIVKGERQDTYIKMNSPGQDKPFSFFFVKETVEEVWAKLGLVERPKVEASPKMMVG
jgi:uncharacterized protein YlzI (FlbEa/FlbD family)